MGYAPAPRRSAASAWQRLTPSARTVRAPRPPTSPNTLPAASTPTPAARHFLLQETLKGTSSLRGSGTVTMDMLDGTRDLADAAKSMPVNPGGGKLRGGASYACTRPRLPAPTCYASAMIAASAS
jgi:hypothetical protein